MTPMISDWISLQEAQALLNVKYTQLHAAIRSGHLTVKKIPGTRPQVSRNEVERLAKDSIKYAHASA